MNKSRQAQKELTHAQCKVLAGDPLILAASDQKLIEDDSDAVEEAMSLNLFHEWKRTPLNSVAPSLKPRVRIGRVPADCMAGGRRALPSYIEICWWQWRWFAWLGWKCYTGRESP